MAITGTWEDREQIRELYARYAYTVDLGRYPEWVQCFTEDGVFESPIFGPHKGAQGLLKFTALYKESQAGAQVRHVMSNVTFVINGDRATGGMLSHVLSLQGQQGVACRGGPLRGQAAQGRWRMAIREPQSASRRPRLRNGLSPSLSPACPLTRDDKVGRPVHRLGGERSYEPAIHRWRRVPCGSDHFSVDSFHF